MLMCLLSHTGRVRDSIHLPFDGRNWELHDLQYFVTGVMERLGLGPDQLLTENPKLIYARMTGYGQKGELSDRAGHDINYISISGNCAFACIGKYWAPSFLYHDSVAI